MSEKENARQLLFYKFSNCFSLCFDGGYAILKEFSEKWSLSKSCTTTTYPMLTRFREEEKIYPLQLSLRKEKKEEQNCRKDLEFQLTQLGYWTDYSTKKFFLLFFTLHHHHHLHEAHISCKRWTKTEKERWRTKKNSNKKEELCNVNVLYHRKKYIHFELHHKIFVHFFPLFFLLGDIRMFMHSCALHEKKI